MTMVVVGADDFREAMAAVVAPVSVVTGMKDGEPHGTTVSAISSLSLDPPMIMVALARDSNLLHLVAETGRVGVNVLAHAQEHIAMRFAKKGSGGFESFAWREQHRVPRLLEASGWLACEIEREVEGGDHVVLLCTVVETATEDRPPLAYHARRFGTHSAAA